MTSKTRAEELSEVGTSMEWKVAGPVVAIPATRPLFDCLAPGGCWNVMGESAAVLKKPIGEARKAEELRWTWFRKKLADRVSLPVRYRNNGLQLMKDREYVEADGWREPDNVGIEPVERIMRGEQLTNHVQRSGMNVLEVRIDGALAK
jgi:hypothetical protein